MTSERNKLVSLAACAALVLVATVGAAASRRAPSQAQLTFAEVQAILLDWLECIECDGGERQRVVALGSVAVPHLEVLAEEGPSARQIEMFVEHLDRSYDAMEQYVARTQPQVTQLPLARQEFITIEVQRLELAYRSRAVRALLAFNREDTREYLVGLSQALEGSRGPTDLKVRQLIEGLLR